MMNPGDWIALAGLVAGASAVVAGTIWRVATMLANLSDRIGTHVDQTASERDTNRADHRTIWGTLEDHEGRIGTLESFDADEE